MLKKRWLQDPDLALYLPLYELDGNSFMSRDPYGHLCTAINAVWTPKGRVFDGTGDYVEGTNHPALNFTTGNFSILVWANVTNTTGGRMLFSRGLINTDGYLFIVGGTDALYLYVNQAAANQEHHSPINTVLLGSPHLYTVVRKGTTTWFYRDDTDLTSSAAAFNNPLTSARTFKIGCKDDKASNPFLGTIGEVMVFNSDLSPIEVQQNYLATKWRYQG
uniref:Putative lectin/glucanase superfamily protein n=1 Tax=viral metagenome TaxID=1070528 RepID=A0A6M3IER5_9ZZZZ